jgi:phage tail sheath protein FI
MPVSPTYPGVYVQEVPSGVRTIVGVSTAIGMFLGTSNKGPIGEPVRCTSYLDLTRNFSEDPTGGSLAEYVKLFFLNGGTDCYVMRMAHGATQSTVDLQNEAGTKVLRLSAKDAGLVGESIRAKVTYNGPQPEATFNIDLFRWDVNSSGQRVRVDQESWKRLSMDPNSAAYAQDFLKQNSKLVDALDVGPAGVDGFSLSGRAVDDTPGFQPAWQTLLGNNPAVTTNRFQLTVGGHGPVMVDLSGITVAATAGTTATSIQNAITAAFNAKGIPGIAVTVTFDVSATSTTRRLRIAPDGVTTHGDVYITPGDTLGTQHDLAVPLMLGTAQGGLEVSGHADRRPAPNGITFRATETNLTDLADVLQNQLGILPDQLTLEAVTPQPNGTFTTTPQPVVLQPPASPNVVTTAGADRVFKDAAAPSPNANSDGVREKLAIIAQRINGFIAVAPLVWKWKAEVWGSRLAILPADELDDNFISTAFALTTNPALPGGAFTNNVHYYSVGASGLSIGKQTSAGAPATDGTPPQAADYDSAYQVIDKEVDLFNLMVLAPDAAVPVTSLYGNASIFCQQRRAFLLMDPPASWTTAQQAATGVAALRVGLVKDYSAIFFPRVTISQDGKNVNIGPAGAIAGLCARIDGTRGVWKAPAGTEADLRGIVGLEYKLSDGDNGITNPRAVNSLRIFPNGIVNWGGRTNDGDDDFASEYKYIPIRRLALYIEESLYRGLKWVVFEPNDEPLWAQIRLNVGAFMHDLFRQGAFQGATPKDAYFVKVDRETTTQSDQNRGIVNIMVGFAPLKPAEFVILYLQQMAGQIQV